jgi:hypothetical protein
MKHLKGIFESNWSEYDYNDAKNYLDLEFIDFLSPVNGENRSVSEMDDYAYYKLIIPTRNIKDIDELEEVLYTHVTQLKRRYPNIKASLTNYGYQIKLVLRNEEVRTPRILNKTDRYPIFGRR